jgi:UDP-N-acetylglucosamine 2-epimerase (non-hydrolysing)
MSSYDFAPTEAARDNLIGEGKNPERVFVTGNTVIDALKFTANNEKCDGKTVLLTAHRRENIGAGLENIFSAARRIAQKYPDFDIVCPLHPNPAVRATAEKLLGGVKNVNLCRPLDLREFHSLLARSVIVMTDSGGVQEEAAALGKPTLVLREKTERTEGGSLILVGTNEDDIVSAFDRLMTDSDYYASIKNTPSPFGDGNASRRIADILERI